MFSESSADGAAGVKDASRLEREPVDGTRGETGNPRGPACPCFNDSLPFTSAVLAGLWFHSAPAEPFWNSLVPVIHLGESALSRVSFPRFPFSLH